MTVLERLFHALKHPGTRPDFARLGQSAASALQCPVALSEPAAAPQEIHTYDSALPFPLDQGQTGTCESAHTIAFLMAVVRIVVDMEYFAPRSNGKRRWLDWFPVHRQAWEDTHPGQPYSVNNGLRLGNSFAALRTMGILRSYRGQKSVAPNMPALRAALAKSLCQSAICVTKGFADLNEYGEVRQVAPETIAGHGMLLSGVNVGHGRELVVLPNTWSVDFGASGVCQIEAGHFFYLQLDAVQYPDFDWHELRDNKAFERLLREE